MGARDASGPAGAALRVFADPAALAEAAALRVAGALRDAIRRRGRASIALAGGSTPRALYRRLAEEPDSAALDWSRVEFFFGDERCVPPTSEHSNHRMASECLLDPLGIRAEAVHRIQGELGAVEAARRYERELAERLDGEPPRFDLVLLGIGADGHTASLFPGTPALAERARWVVPSEAPSEPRERVTLTFPVLDAARAVLFLVSGPDKAAALERVFVKREAEPPPAARVRAAGELAWYVDRAAAERIAGAP